jgi:hypothetical protein
MPNFILSNDKPEYDAVEILLVNIDGKSCKTLDTFYKIIGSQLKFPDYFGENLDAFDEMITDLTWLEEDAIIIKIINFDALLSDEVLEDEEDCKGLILSILDSAADDQKNGTEGTPIKIILDKNEDIETFLEEFGIEFIKTK